MENTAQKKGISKDYIKLLMYLVLLTIGILMLANIISSELIIIIVGIAILAFGAISLIAMIQKKKRGVESNYTFSIIMIVLGVLTLVFYEQSAQVLLPLVIGAFAVISGISTIIFALSSKKAGFGGWIVSLISGIIVVVIGIIILSGIATGADVIGFMLGLYITIFSIISIISWFTQSSYNKKFTV